MQARWGTHGDHPAIALCPRSVRETYDLTIRAFNLSELYRTPVVLLLDEIIGHVNEKVVLPERVTVLDRAQPDAPPESYLPYAQTPSDVPPMANFGSNYRFHVTGLFHDESGFPTNDPVKIDALLRRLERKIRSHADDIIEVDEQTVPGAKIGVFAYGSTARSALSAVREAREGGIPVDFLAPLTIWPFPGAVVARMGERVDHILVPEMNLGQMAHEGEWAVGRGTRVHSLTRVDGEPIRPQQVLDKIRDIAAR